MARLAHFLFPVLILAGLGALAAWGHHTGWTFISRPSAELDHPTDEQVTIRLEMDSGDPEGKKNLPGVAGIPVLRFDSAEAVDAAGIDITPAWRMAMAEEVSTSGEIQFDPGLVARLSSRAPGTAWWVARSEGDSVKTGDVLAVIDAAEVGRAKAEFEKALVQNRLKRQAQSDLAAAQGVISERQRRESEAAVKEAEVRLLGAEQALTNLGLPVRAAEFDHLSLDDVFRKMRTLGVPDLPQARVGSGTSANLVPLRSPFDGVVLSTNVVAGEVVDIERVLFVVVNPKRLWLTLHVGAGQVRKVTLGQKVRFVPDGSKEVFEGKVSWVSTAADETTRTVPVRVELGNDHGRLRASTLGKGSIIVREAPQALTVPTKSIRLFRGTPIVFVRDPHFLKPDGAKSFRICPIVPGTTDGQNTEILSGLKDGDVVASAGLELLIDQLTRALPR